MAGRSLQTHSSPEESPLEVWIGLVGVAPLPGSEALGKAKGAYVNALAWSSSRSGFEEAVSTALTPLGLFAFEFEDVEPLRERTSNRVLDQELLSLAEEVGRFREPRFAAFHTYPEPDG